MDLLIVADTMPRVAKAKVRLTILPILFEADAYSDVVREAQEIVELALKGILRQAGIEPPQWHDVGGLLKIAKDT